MFKAAATLTPEQAFLSPRVAARLDRRRGPGAPRRGAGAIDPSDCTPKIALTLNREGGYGAEGRPEMDGV